jgi:hypothetical protein
MISLKKRFLQYLLYMLFLIGIVVLFLEIFFRFYYPFPRSLKGDNWEMATNVTFKLNNDFNNRLDPVIINHRNSIGFRGEEPPDGINNKLSILTIGGSTTACTFLSDGKTWTDLLGVKLNKLRGDIWINNAGIDGHSSFGHLNFLYYYLPGLTFKPKIALFLIGANDVDRNDLSGIDSLAFNTISVKLKSWFKRNSKTVNFLYDLKWILHPVDIFTDKQNWNFNNFKSVYLEKTYIDSALQKQVLILQKYRERLNNIIALCRQYQIQPVFITQPLVFGDGTVDGGNPAIDFHVFHDTENGMLFWKKLQLYNMVTREVSDEKKVLCIDLATLMPKDTLYYYDIVHYTNEGAAKVADIIYKELSPYLSTSNSNF